MLGDSAPENTLFLFGIRHNLLYINLYLSQVLDTGTNNSMLSRLESAMGATILTWHIARVRARKNVSSGILNTSQDTEIIKKAKLSSQHSVEAYRVVRC
jgi:hypothetical protein